MNQPNFLDLEHENKLAELKSHGVFLDYIIKGVYMVKLYQLENHYVETFYHIEKNRIDSIVSFTNTNKLAPYLKKIKISFTPPPPFSTVFPQ